ncbi:hypothetical protein AVEN_190694-1 [Araneus ventricosus]|uniref:Uncharacterized protein n=1 Tax=Araneus ventricosus TaxID=182803 RepID=A0A4Y2KSD6_ARAVE|nr:hypothetical protein AVEN_190694-1 [Araneus ventricosus]
MALRVALGMPKWTPNIVLMKIAGQEVLSEKIKRLATQFFIRQLANGAQSPIYDQNCKPSIKLIKNDEVLITNLFTDLDTSTDHIIAFPDTLFSRNNFCEIHLSDFSFQNKVHPLFLIKDLFEEAVSEEFYDYRIIATDASKSHSFTSIAAFKLKRKTLRTTFTNTAKAIDEEIAKSQVDVNKLRELSSQLTDKFQRLETTQDSISELLLNENQENEYSKDFNEAEIYRERHLSLRSKIENFEIESNSESQSVKSCDRKYRLPKLELKKFNGDIKSFLGFWSQFSRIHEDEEMPSEDKFQYLIQAITPGTRAASLIESFPPTAQNYPKAIELLKERFGREDLLVQV